MPARAAANTGYADAADGFDLDNLPGSQPVSQADDFTVDELDYDPELDEAMSVPGLGEREAARPSGRRGLFIAAIVGAVAIAGGLGAFALSFGGKGGSEAPVIVKADNSPIKVKPENPGGTVVPNQDNKVYDAVVKGAKPAEPVQQKLVTNTEVPVDVQAKDPARAVDLSADQGAAAGAADDGNAAPTASAAPAGNPAPADNAAPAPKSEDRIAQVLQDTDKGNNTDVVAVAPRKVRTMVVKSDGSLVPREDPAPAAPQVAAAEPIDPAPQHVAPSADADQTGTVAPAAAQADDEPALKPAAKPAQGPVGQHAGQGCDRAAASVRPAGRRRRRGQARPGRVHRSGNGGDRWRFVVDADCFAADGGKRPVDLSGSAAPLWQRACRPHRQHRQGRDRRQGHVLPRPRAGPVAQRCHQPVHQLQGCRRQLLRLALDAVPTDQSRRGPRSRRLFHVH